MLGAATLNTARFEAALNAARPQRQGVVTSIIGLGLEVAGLDVAVGDLVRVGSYPGIEAEVVATTRDGVRCMPLGRTDGLRGGAPAWTTGAAPMVPTGAGLFGRVVDGLGRPIDGKGPLAATSWVPLHHPSPAAMTRTRITEPLQLGVRVLDTLTTVGKGQRLGLFAGSGVGKSSL
ncbi:MAG: EscN/YscN/HrcN family type secretion system ATPase, partial [Glaciihabitans sp.]|nr:EscN/YscN/HrcN family type secretion system ATPase [Glaciihabitans sp.]